MNVFYVSLRTTENYKFDKIRTAGVTGNATDYYKNSQGDNPICSTRGEISQPSRPISARAATVAYEICQVSKILGCRDHKATKSVRHVLIVHPIKWRLCAELPVIAESRDVFRNLGLLRTRPSQEEMQFSKTGWPRLTRTRPISHALSTSFQLQKMPASTSWPLLAIISNMDRLETKLPHVKILFSRVERLRNEYRDGTPIVRTLKICLTYLMYICMLN